MTTAHLNDLAMIAGDYTVDQVPSRVWFVARHRMASMVRGAFTTYTGTVHIDEDVSRSHATLSVDADSVDTRNTVRDRHLRARGFLDVRNHPSITFESTAARRLDDVTFELSGDLTVRGVARRVAIPFECRAARTDVFGIRHLRFSGSVHVSRKNWGIAGTLLARPLVDDRVILEFDISAVEDTRSTDRFDDRAIGDRDAPSR